MGKANALKAKAAETAAAAGAGNLQVSQPRSLLTSLYFSGVPEVNLSSGGLSFRFIAIMDRDIGPLVGKSYLGIFQSETSAITIRAIFQSGKKEMQRARCSNLCFDTKSAKDELTKRAVLHPLFCACASCASASTYVCAPMCSNSFHMCFQAAQMSPHVVKCHLHTYVCMRLHMNMYIYLKTFI